MEKDGTARTCDVVHKGCVAQSQVNGGDRLNLKPLRPTGTSPRKLFWLELTSKNTTIELIGSSTELSAIEKNHCEEK